MPSRRKAPAPLDAYRAKRSAERTPEPFRGSALRRPGLFVVQRHAARRTHYDLRLEWQGVLKSWAVPKGPSLDPAAKRLAVEVEDHPVEYADFEGIIPEGNYGAGAVTVWDQGRWIPLGDVAEGWAKGKLLFELRGHKLRGLWTLFRTRQAKQWLLVKKPDGFADPGRRLPEASIFSGLTVEELRDGVDRAAEIEEALARLGAPRRRVAFDQVGLMHPVSRERPFSDPAWWFELKYDGFRLLAGREGGRAVLRYRRGSEATATFPEIAQAVAHLPAARLLLDGEVVVLDEAGRPDFQRLQQRFRLARPADIARASVELPALYFAFDLLLFGPFDLRSLPLAERHRLLARLLPPAGPLRCVEHLEADGERFYREVQRLGLEGIVGKRATSPYRAGRSSYWVRIRVERTEDFVIVGYAPLRSRREGIGALHLAAYRDDQLVYCGRVGSGFGEADRRALAEMLAEARREVPPCAGAPAGAGSRWVEPRLVCEVRFKERTREGFLRQPVFLRLRPDKEPGACRLRGFAAPTVAAASPETSPSPPQSRELAFSNLDKVFWPDAGYTKGDLVAYYQAIAPWMLPYLRDRPVVLVRYPDGIGGKSFFQKDAPAFAPSWMRTEGIWSEDSRRELRYFVLDDPRSLLYVANLGAIALHVWSSRIGSLERPDWCVVDLDPRGAPLSHVVRVARELHALCRRIGLPSFVKTSGASGLHVLVPLAAQCTYEQARTLARLLARVVADRLPDIATLVRAIRERAGKVYLDCAQNGYGRLLVAPFSVRPLSGAPVSMPLRWGEVTAQLDPARFTIRSAPARLRRLGLDPLRGVLEQRPDLLAALKRLHALLEEDERGRRPRGSARARARVERATKK